jgi:hypothetical protein
VTPPPSNFGPLGYPPYAAPLGDQPAWLGGAPLGGVQAPVGAMTMRPATAPAAVRRRIGGAVAAVGGAVVVAGTFADWVMADVRGVGVRTGTGWQNIRGHVADGPVIAAIALVIVIVGMTFVFDLQSRVARAAGIVASLAVVAFAVYEIADIEATRQGVDTSLRAGIWVMVGGAVLALVGLVVTFGRRRPAAASGAPPPPSPMPSVPPSGPPLLG